MRTRSIRKLYEASTPVNPWHFLGKNSSEAEWTVSMLTGPVLDLRFFGHRKRFWLDGKTVRGCNVLGKDRQWGFFTVEQECSSTTINYDDARNRLSRLIVDYVRVTDYANLVIGKFNLRIFGKPRLVGYFTLGRRGDHRRSD